MLAMRLFAAALTALVAAIFWLTPGWTRRDIFFTVTVGENFRDGEEGRAILSRYRRWIFFWSLAGLAVALFAPAWHGAVMPGGVFLIVIGAGVALSSARRATWPYAVAPSTVREASLDGPPPPLTGGFAAQLLPFAALVAVGIFLRAHWSAIPDSFVIHWTADGTPNGWGHRTGPNVFGPLFIGGALCLLLGSLALGLARATRPQSPSGAPLRAERQFRRGIAWTLIGTEYLLAGMFAVIALLPLFPSLVMWIVVLGLSIPALATAPIVLLAHRRARDLAGHPGGGDRTDDANWRAGIFYVNREDPALFVEKRFGIGYTLNFGNPWSWVMMALLAALPVVSIFALR